MNDPKLYSELLQNYSSLCLEKGEKERYDFMEYHRRVNERALLACEKISLRMFGERVSLGFSAFQNLDGESESMCKYISLCLRINIHSHLDVVSETFCDYGESLKEVSTISDKKDQIILSFDYQSQDLRCSRNDHYSSLCNPDTLESINVYYTTGIEFSDNIPCYTFEDYSRLRKCIRDVNESLLLNKETYNPVTFKNPRIRSFR